MSATRQMTAWTAYLDSTGTPRLKITLRGVWQGVQQELDAIVDTGFSGFLSMPMVDAFPLGLVLYGTTTTILADGSPSPKLMAVGTVAVGTEEKVGVILLNMGSGASAVLVGMEILRIFNKSHFLIKNTVILVDSPATAPASAPESTSASASASASGSAPPDTPVDTSETK